MRPYVGRHERRHAASREAVWTPGGGRQTDVEPLETADRARVQREARERVSVLYTGRRRAA